MRIIIALFILAALGIPALFVNQDAGALPTIAALIAATCAACLYLAEGNHNVQG